MNALAEAPVETDSTVDIQPKHPAGVPRPWPSVKQPTVGTDRPNNEDARPRYVRGQRNMTVYSVTR
jgi:hypothetical protein